MNTPPGKGVHRQFRYRRYGVYDLTYEDIMPPSFTSRIYLLLDSFQEIRENIPYARRQLIDMIKLAPAEFVTYIVTTTWHGVYPAICLYWLNALCDRLGGGSGASSPEICWSLATSWISCALVDVVAQHARTWALEGLTKRFRAYFIPQLISASLRVDLLSMQDLYTTFPVRGHFESESPGGPFLEKLTQLVVYLLELASQAFVLLHVISRKQSPEREALLYLLAVHGLVWWLAPSNGIGCSAFIFWINNRHFQRMKTLFGLAFSRDYRFHLVLDGIASSIETEYRKSAMRLGNNEFLDPTPWRTELRRDWYWDFLTEITLDLPVAIYALILPAHLSPSSIASMVFLQQAVKSVSLSLGTHTIDPPSLLSVCSRAKRLYDAINHKGAMPQGTASFPRLVDSSYDAGMKISFRHVSLQYPGSDHQALDNVSFDILPGELVLVVGANGSGKSSMLKLLARLFDPTAGEILIDDLPLVRYDMDQLRSAMAFQSQSPVVYPVTVRENIVLGLPPTCNVEREHVEEAARRSNCSEWISRLSDGYDTRLQTSFDVNLGWLYGMYGTPSEALKEELVRHEGHKVSISDGEKQRLATARTFMRINHRATRLVVIDEATSSLDPIAERHILSEFRSVRAGRTIILVTHRFHHLAHEADRILCMKDGRVVESGTHTELVHANGDYATLYHAQVEQAC